MAEHVLQSIAFPTLTEQQVTELAECTNATFRRYRDGDVLIEVGVREFPCFVVIRGSIEILDVSGSAPRTLVVHEARQFTGDVSHVTGNPAVIQAVARGETIVHAITTAALKRMINLCPEIGDIVMQAFIAEGLSRVRALTEKAEAGDEGYVVDGGLFA